MSPVSPQGSLPLSTAALIGLVAVIALIPTPAPASTGDEPPAWLVERAETLLAATPTGEDAAAFTDTLLALADELTALGFHGRAAHVREEAGIHAFRRTDLDRAVTIFGDGVQYARDHGERQREGALLNALAIGYSVTDRNDEAIATYGESLALKVDLGDTAGVGRTWANLASTYQGVGRLGEALDALTEADRWTRLAGNERGRIHLLVNRANLLDDLGRPHEALAVVDSAIAMTRGTDEFAAIGQAQRSRARILRALGRPEAALDALDRAIDTLESAGERYYLLFSYQDRIDVLRNLGRADEARDALARFAGALDGDEVVRLRPIERLFAGLLELDAGHPGAAIAALDEAVVAFEERRREQDDEITRAGMFRGSGDVYGALALAHLAAGDTLAAWRSNERGQAMLFRERVLGSTQIADLGEVQRVLDQADAILVQACETQVEPLAWFVVTPDSLHVVTVGPPLPLATDAQALLTLLATDEGETWAGGVLTRLADRLLGPLMPWLGPDGARRLYLVAPQRLSGIPMAILPLPGGTGRLDDRVVINHVPSASALVAVAGKTAAGSGMLAMGDPVLASAGVLAQADASPLPRDPVRQAAATPLPEARREVRSIAPPDATVLLGEQARRSTFEELAGGQAVLHLATHALHDPLDGRRSTLLLASESPDLGPARLTAAACETLALRTDLAVLSACRSGLGHHVLGEGSFGLPRSLLVAGSRSVVSTLWDVEDRAARRFMEAFYAGLRDGLPRDVALQRAARQLSDSGAPVRDWAAFVLTGVGHEPVPAIVGTARTGWNRLEIWTGVGAVAILVIVVLAGRRGRRRA